MNNKGNNFLAGIREKTAQFMYGRYGGDQFSRALLIAAVAVMVVGWIVSSFTKGVVVGLIFYAVQILLLVWIGLRVFSRNIDSRAKENQKYLQMTKGFHSWINLQKRRWRERKTHAFRKCPNCKRTLRLARKKGTHTAHCPLCGHSFTVKF